MNPAGRGGFIPNRGGSMGPRGRGGPMVVRGDRGRGRGMYNNMGGRGGSMNQAGGSFRGRGTGRGFNRGGGSFNQGYSYGSQSQGQQYHQPHHQYQNQYHQNQYHHQNQYGYNNSFRGRGRGRGFYQSSHGSHHDGGSVASARDGGSVVSTSFPSGKKDENRRTLTDFKIVGLTIPELGWSWGATPDGIDGNVKTESGDSVATAAEAEGAAGDSASTAMKPESSMAAVPPPPSRLRIYFHTPVSPDDSHLISGSYGSASAVRTGKRKKVESDDGDYDEERGGRPPPNGSGFAADGRESASVVSEADWLMQAIGDEEGDGDGGENLHVSEVDNYLEGEADDYGEHPFSTGQATVMDAPSRATRSFN